MIYLKYEVYKITLQKNLTKSFESFLI